MFGWNFLSTAVIAISLCNGVRAADPAREYPIRLSWPSKVGEKYDLAVTCSRSVEGVMTSPGEKSVKSRPEVLTIRMEATLEPLVVDSKGRAGKLSCTIKKLLRIDGKEPVEVLPAGSIVIVDSTGKDPAAIKGETYCTMNRVRLPEEPLSAVLMAVDAKVPEEPSDDECYGTTARQKVGASWPIDVAKASKERTWEGWTLMADPAKAKMTLVSVEPIDGKDRVKTSLDITSEKFAGTANPGQTVEKASMHVVSVVSVPLEGVSLNEIGTSDVTMVFVSRETGNGPPFTLEATTKVHTEWRIAPQAK